MQRMRVVEGDKVSGTVVLLHKVSSPELSTPFYFTLKKDAEQAEKDLREVRHRVETTPVLAIRIHSQSGHALGVNHYILAEEIFVDGTARDIVMNPIEVVAYGSHLVRT